MTTIPSRAAIPNRRKGARAIGKTPTVRRIQLAEVRSRAEYNEALRTTDQRMAVADKARLASSTTQTRSAWDVETVGGHPDRPLPDSLHIAPERARHILDGTAGVVDTGMGQEGRRKRNSRPTGTTRRSSGTSWTWHALPTTRLCSRPTADGGYMAIVTMLVLPSLSSPMAGSGQRGRTLAARESSRTRGRHSERIRSHRAGQGTSGSLR